MGRVNRLMERRALRRAADQALLTSLGSATPGRGGGAPDQDFEYTRSAPVEVSAPRDHEPVTEPIPVVGVQDLSFDWSDVDAPAEPAGGYDFGADHADESDAAEITAEAANTHGWDERDGSPPPGPPLRARPIPEAGYLPPTLDFAMAAYRGQPWYRTKPAAGVLVAAGVVALASGGWLLLRSPAAAVEQSSTEAPTSAAPVPSKASPTAVSAAKPPPAPLPPPAPPPPPAERTYSPPQRQYSPRYSDPTPAQKPRIDVTRAPMSVAPVPKPVPNSGSNTPGDAPDRDSGRRRHGCFGFC